MNTSTLLEKELAPLNAKIKELRGSLTGLEVEKQAAEDELGLYAVDRERFDALRQACNVLERLDELEAGNLFWGGLPEFKDTAGHIARLRGRVAEFDQELGGVLARQARCKSEIDRHLDELDYLYDAVHDAHDRDERREEEFAIVRELSPDPEHELVMPWSHSAATERRFRRAMSTAMFLSLLLTVIVRVVQLPVPVRPVVAEIPERLAMMVRKEHPKPAPVHKPKEEKKADSKEEKKEPPKAEKEEKAPVEKRSAKPQEKTLAPERPQAPPAEQVAAPKRSQNTGVLAFKDAFKDLLDETPVPKLGAEARLANPATHNAGHALASRSLVSMQGGPGSGGGIGGAVSRNVGNGGSGGIGNAAIGRKVGSGGSDGRLGRGDGGFAQVKSSIGGPGNGSGSKDGRPTSSGARPARTDEEIQILFDRYKAALYRIYNTELRKDPTLRGKMVLKLAIEPSGVVSACSVDSTNISAPEFCGQIVERVRKFNFGPKEGVPKTTILYPIDFLPAR